MGENALKAGLDLLPPHICDFLTAQRFWLMRGIRLHHTKMYMFCSQEKERLMETKSRVPKGTKGTFDIL